MASRPIEPWFNAKFIVGLAINLGTVLFLGGIFYATTNIKQADTDQRFIAIDKRFDVLALAVDQAKQKAIDIGKTEAGEREKSRADFLQRAEKTADGIAEVNKKLAVQETIQNGMAATLNRISDSLGVLTGRPAVPTVAGRR